MNSKCHLSQLKNPSLQVLLPGWSIVQNSHQQPELQFDSSLLSCCHESGQLITDEGVILCGLNKRMSKVKKLEQEFLKASPTGLKAFDLQGTPNRNRSMLEWLARDSQQGFVLQERTHLKDPGLLWMLAMVAIWRFGRDAIVLRLSHNSVGDLANSLNRLETEKALVLVELVVHPSNPDVALTLDFIVNWCHNSRVPLWIECPTQAVKLRVSDIHKASLLGQIQKNLQRKQTASFEHWISKQTMSRLKEVAQIARTSPVGNGVKKEVKNRQKKKSGTLTGTFRNTRL